MKALVLSSEKRGVLLKQLSLNKIEKDEVLIKVKVAGICATDIKLIRGLYYNTDIIKENVILGHEGAGEIIQVGCNVKDYSVGDHVTFEAINPCGECYYCQKELTNVCVNWRHLGINMNGVFADYAVIPVHMLHKLPSNISYETAALLEPLAIAVHSIERINVKAVESCAIIGPGPLGLMHIPVLLSRNINKIVVFGLSNDEMRLKLAKKIGADKTVNISESHNKSNLEKFDLVIDTSGSASSIDLTFNLIRDCGQVALLGIDDTGQYKSVEFIKRNLTITGGKGMAKRHMDEAIKLLEQYAVNVSKLITHTYPLEKYEEAFKVSRDKTGVKILFVNEGELQ